MARRGARRTRWIALLFITCVLITLLVTAARAQEDEVAEGEEVFEDAGELNLDRSNASLNIWLKSIEFMHSR